MLASLCLRNSIFSTGHLIYSSTCTFQLVETKRMFSLVTKPTFQDMEPEEKKISLDFYIGDPQ